MLVSEENPAASVNGRPSRAVVGILDIVQERGASFDKDEREWGRPLRNREDEKSAPMRGALRTLQVLRALNVRNGATVSELTTVTGISRPALYRILETLREAGYVAVDLEGQHYGLTMLVRSLAEGFSEEDWVTSVARPVLKQLQKEVVWPADLGTFMGNAMWIRETTRHVSPLTMDRGVAGARFCLLSSATGRAYLAFCGERERELILRNVARSPEPGNELINDRGRLNAILEETRARGYGQRYGEPPTESGAIATPIIAGERVLGCVNITFAAGALHPSEAAELHLAAMQRASRKIADGAVDLEASRAGEASR
jgi:IclR family mhp operon transcriptional activator